DGKLDLAVTNFSGEYLAVYRNMDGSFFEDASARTGVARATSRNVGFGLSFADLNLDGLPDLSVANGHVTEAAQQFYPGGSLAQPNLVLLQNPPGVFSPLTNPGTGVTQLRASRGLAAADLDGDGDLDLAVNNWKEAPDLLRNDLPNRGHWLRLRLEGSGKNRLALGARVRVAGGGRTQTQEVRSGGSYLSQEELTLTFGLGAATQVEAVEVYWPGSRTPQRFPGLAVDQEHRLRQTKGN
ncbi:MAG: CRTAC1 family protein, partial [Armatimonadetes bacterium]|nr:CRTAC1 family protein [Armatimonadota bacterium]